jgi:subtilisin-like proprotein convertase family protein
LVTLSYSATTFGFCSSAPVNIAAPSTTGTPNTFTSSPALTSGLTLNAATGAITGTSPASGGSTMYTVTASNGTCERKTNMAIAVNPQPTGVTATASATICEGSSTPLNSTGSAQQFSSYRGGFIQINSFGNANPYPSTIDVSGLTGNITNITVSLNNMRHSFPRDLDVVLFGPAANSVLFTNRLGGAPGISNVTYTFAIGAPALGLTNVPSGTYGVVGTSYSGAGLPGAISGADLNNFIGTTPNGTWRLFVYDDAGGDAGFIDSWTLNLTTTAGLTYSWSPATGLSDATIANPTASPTVTTDYTLTVTGANAGCPVTSAPVTITVSPQSVAPSSINSSSPIACFGQSTTLSVVGGTLATGAQWEWFSGSCGGTPVGTGASITVSPTANTTYFVRASAGTTCPASACTSLLVSGPTTTNALAQNGDVATCLVNTNNFIHFYNPAGRLIASINSNGEDLGNVTVTAHVGSPHIVPACDDDENTFYFTAAMGRSFVIQSQNNPEGTFAVRTYYADAEFDAYILTANTGTPDNPNDTPSGIAEMQISRFTHNIPTSEDGDPNNNCGVGTGILLPNAGAASGFSVAGNNYTGAFSLDFNTAGFSEFYAMFNGFYNSALPVTLTSFNAECMDKEVAVRWTTATEYNASHYNLQSSRDGLVWSDIARIEAAGTTNQASNYSFTDHNFSSLNYYRLVQVDFDGTSEIFGPISAKCDIDASNMTVYPNPTDADFSVLIETMEAIENAVIELVDLSGRTVQMKEMSITAGNTVVKFETKTMNPGTYIVLIKGMNDKFTPVRVVVM